MTYIVVILIGIAYYIWFYRNEAEKFLTKNSMLANKENINFARKNKLFLKQRKWSKEQRNNIVNFFKGSSNIDKILFYDNISNTTMAVFEDRDIVFYDNKNNWKHVKIEEIEDIRTEGSKQDFSLTGAIVGNMIAGGIGAAIGSMGSTEMKVHIVIKEFNNKDYTLLFNDKDVINDLGNLLYKLYKPSSDSKIEKVSAVEPHEEIVKFKNLLDGGIITQEEFDFKKKELLNL